jgi:hypothetical protein
MVPVDLPINPSLVPSGSSTWSDERALRQIKREAFSIVTLFWDGQGGCVVPEGPGCLPVALGSGAGIAH